MDAGAFSDDAVVTAMQDMILVSVDAESETGAPLAKQFKVRGYPTLLFLNSDGTPRDTGRYMEPAEWKANVERIISGEGTITALTKSIDTNPNDLESRVALAGKLQEFGDQAGYDAQVEEVLKRDPQNKLAFTRKVHYDRILKRAFAPGEGKDASPQLLADYLETIDDPGLLLNGYYQLSSFYQREAEKQTDTEALAAVRAKTFHYQQLAWKSCPESQQGGFGNQLAWGLWEDRENLNDDAKAFALEVAMVAAEKSDADANVLDTLAVCYFMNGKLEQAILTIDRCIEMQPDNETWKERRASFESPN